MGRFGTLETHTLQAVNGAALKGRARMISAPDMLTVSLAALQRARRTGNREEIKVAAIEVAGAAARMAEGDDPPARVVQ